MVLWQQVPTDRDYGDPVAVRLFSGALSYLRGAQFLQVPVHIPGSAEPNSLGRLGQQTERGSSRATLRSRSHSPTFR